MARMLRKALEGLLSEEEIRLLYGGFDIVGDIAVIKIPDALLAKKKLIAETLLRQVKPVKTVLMQTTPVSGEYRTRSLELIGGEDRTTTVHREHGCTFNVDLAQAYFSPRLSAERLRVAEMVQPGETVTNLFAGVGAFSIIIAKKVPETRVYSIDINPAAHQLAVENIRLNKVSDQVTPILGDARRVIDEVKGRADRVLMPLPEKAADYLEVAVEALKPPTGIIHYYTHTYAARREEAFKEALKELDEAIGGRYEAIAHRIVREVGPRWYQVALDLRVSTSTSSS
ncbi:MAG: class I SAM-dependent methyltransferase family protein [Nitrososphaerales archaeon]